MWPETRDVWGQVFCGLQVHPAMVVVSAEDSHTRKALDRSDFEDVFRLTSSSN